MAVRDHALHRDASDERVRQSTRDRQLDLERRRLAALIQQPHEYLDHRGQPAPNEDIVTEGMTW